MSPQLLVADMDRSIDFYTDKLGFTLEFRYEDFYAGIIKDGFSIHLKSGKASPEERKSKKENEDLDIVFSVARVKDLYDELVFKKIEILQQLCERPYGEEFYVVDPDGYILAFLGEV
jgi:catechol 2,3-dioxygenase-like lactoylglutathione lyase family enzyme